MTVIANAVEPAQSFYSLDVEGNPSLAVARLRQLSGWFFGGYADMAEVTEFFQVFSELDELLKAPLSEQLPDSVPSSEWPCTEVSDPDNAPKFATPWIDFGTVDDEGDVGGDTQLGTAWGRRFIRQRVDEKWILLDFAIYVDAHDVNEPSWSEAGYTAQLHVSCCTDYRRPGETEEWSDYHYGTVDELLPTDDDAEEDEDGQVPVDQGAANERAKQIAREAFSVEDIEDTAGDWDGEEPRRLIDLGYLGEGISW